MIRKLLLLFCLIVGLAACQSQEQAEDTDTSKTSAGGADLTIANLICMDDLSSIAREYMKERPDILIESRDYALNVYSEDPYRYVEEITTQLLSGNAPDIISLYGDLYYKFGVSLYLTDLYEIINNDPEFHMADYYENVIALLDFNGKLAAFPTRFTQERAVMNNLLQDQAPFDFTAYETITYIQVLELYDTFPQEIQAQYKPFYGNNVGLAARYLLPVDFAGQTADLLNPDFIHALELTLRTTDQETDFEERFASYRPASESNANIDFIFGKSDGYLQLLPHDKGYGITAPRGFYGLEQYFTLAVPLANEGGAVYTTIDGGTYAINAASKNKELAWDLIKYATLAKETGNPAYQFGNRIHRQMNEEKLYNHLHTYVTDYSTHELTEDMAADLDQAMMEIKRTLAMPATHLHIADMPGSVDILRQLHRGLLTPEQAAAQMQDRLEIFFWE